MRQIRLTLAPLRARVFESSRRGAAERSSMSKSGPAGRMKPTTVDIVVLASAASYAAMRLSELFGALCA